MTFDNANRKAIREAEKAAKLAETNRIAYTRTIMSTSFGRAWLYDILLGCNVFHTPFVAGGPDITAFNCGKQNVGLRLFGDIAAHCPHEYSLMMTEASTKDEANDRRYSESSDDAGRDTTSTRPDWNPTQPADNYTIDNSGFVNDASDPGGEARSHEDA